SLCAFPRPSPPPYVAFYCSATGSRCFCIYCSGDLRDLHSFPTRRSSDLDGRHDGGYYTVKDCVTIDVLPRTPGNNVYVGFMVWSNFTATKCRGLVSLNQVIKEIICLQPLK